MAGKDSNLEGWKHIHKEAEKNKQSILNRFVDRIRSTFQKFQNKPTQDFQLTGRIQDLQRTAFTVMQELEVIKQELKKEIDADVFFYVEDVIDPITREVSRLNKSLEQPGTVTHQAKAYQRYSQWIEKAKLWIQVCSKAKDREGILKAIIRYTIDDFLEVIDRDLQVLNDYQEHMLDALAIDEEEKIALAQRLELRLEPYIKGLNELRVRPMDLSLQQIAIWKSQVDKRREKYFDASLHAIDKIINQSIPDSSSDSDQEHLVDVLSQIVYLEHECPRLYDEIYMAKKPNQSQIDAFSSRLISLEHEAHQLNLDLRLTPDLIERLQVITDMLEQVKVKFKDINY